MGSAFPFGTPPVTYNSFIHISTRRKETEECGICNFEVLDAERVEPYIIDKLARYIKVKLTDSGKLLDLPIQQTALYWRQVRRSRLK